MSSLALFFIRIYQYAVSPLLGCNCRFEPSCSHYAAEAVNRHGLIKGGLLTIQRILRCQPLAKSGYDPVPASNIILPRKQGKNL